MDLMDCSMVLCWLSGFLAGALCFVVMSRASSERDFRKRMNVVRESATPENTVYESERARFTLTGWHVVQRKRPDVVWLVVDWSADVLDNEPVYAGDIGMRAFQDSIELDHPLSSDDAPEPVRLSVGLKILPGATVRLRDVFVLRGESPVMVSFDDGETLIPLVGSNEDSSLSDQSSSEGR